MSIAPKPTAMTICSNGETKTVERGETLDLSKGELQTLQIPTEYCVGSDLHDLHVRKAIAAGYKPIPVRGNIREEEPMALVCSGPSLKSTWEEIKGFKTILTCSGAHNFLVERGIIPTYHAETDPRAHKAKFTNNPQAGVMYLIASNCHPDVFASLTGHDVRIWHVLGKADLSEYPRGHWAVTGGANVGLRAMILARILGYVNIHIFGMDCCADASAVFHANDHPNEPKEKSRRKVVINGREFVTSDVFLEYARQFRKETLMISDAHVTLHGDGLLQALTAQQMADPEEIKARAKWVAEKGNKVIAMTIPETFTPDYAEQNRLLHTSNAMYGIGGGRHAKTVLRLVELYKARSVLDYGCGKGQLARELDFPIWEYDPGVPGKEKAPRPSDLVVCLDVLEHVEPEFIDAVLADLARVTRKSLFATIHTGPSTKCLPDGRNAHVLQQPPEWWKAKLAEFFKFPDKAFIVKGPMIYLTAEPKLT